MFSFLVSATNSFCGNFQEKFSAGDFLDVGKEGYPALPLESSKNQNFSEGPEEAEFDPGLSNVLTKDVLKVIRVFQPLKSICLLESVKCV